MAKKKAAELKNLSKYIFLQYYMPNGIVAFTGNVQKRPKHNILYPTLCNNEAQDTQKLVPNSAMTKHRPVVLGDHCDFTRRCSNQNNVNKDRSC